MKYWLNAVDKHSLHAPFIYTLFTEIISSKKEYYCFEHLRKIREELFENSKIINIKDYGAGSLKSGKKERQVKDIAKSGLSTVKFSEFLFKLLCYYKPSRIIELGTSLGLNSLYLSSWSSSVEVFTFEGCPETAAFARELFKKEKKENIEIIEGNLDFTLKEHLSQQNSVDFIYFDANHRYEPTLRYFEQCIQKAHSSSVFIFDDIHWSQEMEKAWNEIKNHPKVSTTVDIFDAGLVFFEKGLTKNHYTVEF